MSVPAPLVTTERPSWVPAGFAGRCKVFPQRDTLLLGYQSGWVKDNARLKLMEKGRQIGLSWSTAYRLVSTTSLKGARFDDWISSRDDLQARLLIEDCKAFAGVLNIGAEDLGERVVDEQKHSAYVLKYSNGRQTHSLSSNADAQAGKRGRRVLDEFALHPDPRKLYAISYHGITWGGNMELISTHRGSANFFNELVQEIRHKGNPKKFSLHTVTLQTALDHGFLFKLQTKLPADDERQGMDEAEYFDFIKAGCPDLESFLQECMCVPADDNSAFLTYDMIAGCEYPATERWEAALGELALTPHPLFVGVDIGRDHDLTVIWVFERINGTYFTRMVIEMQGTPFSTQEATLYPILRLPMMRRCCIDRTGIGRQFAERAQERFGQYKIEAVNFSAAVKEELAYPVRAGFEDRSLRIPQSRVIRADLRSIRKETTAAGNVRFGADRGKNGHADRFWGLALALHAGKAGAVGRPVPPRHGPRASALKNRKDRSISG